MVFRAVAMLVLGGALMGFMTSLVLPRRYVARAAIAVEDSTLIRGAADRTLSPRFLSMFIAQDPHYAPLLDFTPMGEIVDQIRRDTVITPEGPGTCAVRYTDDDRYAALSTTQTLMDQLRRDLGDAKVKQPVEVGITGPGAALCAFEGAAAGFAVGLCLWFAAARSQESANFTVPSQ